MKEDEKAKLFPENFRRKFLWLVGQAVKTPPSHGGIRGSIPLRAVDYFKNSPTLEDTYLS